MFTFSPMLTVQRISCPRGREGCNSGKPGDGDSFPTPSMRDAFITSFVGMSWKLKMLSDEGKPRLEHPAIFHPGLRQRELTSLPETGYRGAHAVQFSIPCSL